MPSPKIIIVTGANRGIGLAICKQILAKPDIAPFKLFAASRQGHRLGLRIGDGDREVLYPKLDIGSSDSIHALEDEVRRHGEVSALINNAGINLDADYGVEAVRKTMDVNFRGTLKMCQTFLPHLSNTGRIVNLSSVSSTLKFYSPAIQERLRSPTATLEDLEQLAQEYESSVRTNSEAASGFGTPIRSYAFSKALIRSSTTILARENPQNLILSCCPGWIQTSMGSLVSSRSTRPPKTPEEGARIPVRLAFDPALTKADSGAYFANDSVRSKDLGKVQEWTRTSPA